MGRTKGRTNLSLRWKMTVDVNGILMTEYFHNLPELANKLGISHSSLVKIVQGRTRCTQKHLQRFQNIKIERLETPIRDDPDAILDMELHAEATQSDESDEEDS